MKFKVVVASGYFDPLHIGHLEYLEKSRALGDRLIVILNNDKQALLKKDKVFMPLDERKKILEALRFVDEVVISIDEDKSVCKTLEKIKPAIFANGGDRHQDEVPEAGICKELSIEMIDGMGEKIQASSELIKKFEEGREK